MVARGARYKGKILIDFFPLEPGVQVLGSLGNQLEIEPNLFPT